MNNIIGTENIYELQRIETGLAALKINLIRDLGMTEEQAEEHICEHRSHLSSEITKPLKDLTSI